MENEFIPLSVRFEVIRVAHLPRLLPVDHFSLLTRARCTIRIDSFDRLGELLSREVVRHALRALLVVPCSRATRAVIDKVQVSRTAKY
jgi:hypothetical protein